MPIFDFRCPSCGKVRRDVFIYHWKDPVVCGCNDYGTSMEKIPSLMVPHTFPADGIFLENVSADGKLFHSKKEMRKYAKDHDLEIGYLE